VNKIIKWSAVIIISGTVGLGFWVAQGLFDTWNYDNPASTHTGEMKGGEVQILPGESFSIPINLVKESMPYASFRYSDTVTTDCIARTFETGKYLNMQIKNPDEDIIVDVDAKVGNPFYVCALNLKEGVRVLWAGSDSFVSFESETKGVYTMIISNPQDVPVDVTYRLTDEVGHMVRPNT